MRQTASGCYGTDWNYAKAPDGTLPLNVVQAILLQEIRDELKILNRLLGCPNFTGIPATLRAIQRNTAKPRKTKGSLDE